MLTSEIVMVLSKQEANMINTERNLKQQRLEKKAKQESCQHEWKFVCHCHNDAAYECSLCGASDYW